MKNGIKYFLIACMVFSSILFVRAIVTGVSLSDQIEIMARAAEKWANECTWLP